MATAHEFQWTARDGLRLFTRSWEPGSEPLGAVGIVHGLGEHSGRYEEFAQQLAQSGYRVLAFDQRGHGRTPGPRGHVRDYDLLLDDIGMLVQEAAERSDGRPVVLYGHSLGGNLVLNYVLRRKSCLTGVIAASPLLRPAVRLPWWKEAAGRVMNRVWPRFSFDVGVDDSALTHDMAALAARKQDPWIHRRVSARLGAQMLDAGRWALEHAERLRLPALVMHGDADTATSPEATREFAHRAGSNCTLRIWPGLYHELHWERGRSEIIQDIIQWLQSIPHQRAAH